VPGIQMFKELKSLVTNPADTFWDPLSQSAYFYDGTNFWTGEDAQSIQARANYVHCNGLAGAMVFSMYDLDDPTNTLFNDVVNDLAAPTSSCTNPPPTTTGNPPPTTTTHNPPPTTTTTNPPPTTTTNNPPPTTTTAGSGGCAGIAAWNANTSYVPNDVVTFNGHKWTSLYWSTGVQPGSPIAWNIWKDNGAC